MKIIKRGYWEGEVTYGWTCDRCSSQIEAQGYEGCQHATKENYRFFFCPVCTLVVEIQKRE